MAVDHGEKRIGLAISDPTDTIARPLTILTHLSRVEDARRVLRLVREHEATAIVIGQSLDEAGRPNLAGRRASRFAEALMSLTELPIVMWDESLSTHDAHEWQIASGSPRKKRGSRVDAVAAAVILQSYLEAQRDPMAGQAG